VASRGGSRRVDGSDVWDGSGESVAFTGTRGGLARCDAATIEAFVATLAGYQVKTVEQKLGALRSFLQFVSTGGTVTGLQPLIHSCCAF
jgi:hypothetical protein